MPSRPSPELGERWARVGFDLGTSGLKAVALDASGLVVARASVEYGTTRSEPGAAEQNPAHWILAVAAAATMIQHTVPASQWAGMSLSAMLPTLVCLDNTLQPVGSAITWEDSRAQDQANLLHARAANLYELTGQVVDARYLLPMWMRLRDVEPERIARTQHVVGAKDYVFAWLTGQLATDPSTAAGYGCYDLDSKTWLADVLTAAGVSFSLPTVLASTHVEPLVASAAETMGLPTGLPVALGAADSVLGALGMSAHIPGDVAYVAGTSTVILGVVKERPNDSKQRFIVTPMAHSGTWGVEMDLLSTGAAIRWMSNLLGFASVDDAMVAAREAENSQQLTTLPYVSPGEQGALWDPDLRGVIAGLAMTHTRGDVMRSLVDAIVLESARCIDVLREYGCSGDYISVAGGSALDPWFRQQLADATGAVIRAPGDGDSDYSAIGAALLLGGTAGVAELSETAPKSPPSQWQARMARMDELRRAVKHGIA